MSCKQRRTPSVYAPGQYIFCRINIECAHGVSLNAFFFPGMLVVEAVGRVSEKNETSYLARRSWFLASPGGPDRPAVSVVQVPSEERHRKERWL